MSVHTARPDAHRNTHDTAVTSVALDAAILALLTRSADPDGVALVAIRDIASMLGCSNRSVSQAVNRLKANGHLTDKETLHRVTVGGAA